MLRKLLIVAAILAVLILAGLPALTAVLTQVGAVGLATYIRDKYVTGTALTIIAVLLALLPNQPIGVSFISRTTRVCRVCECPVPTNAKYCGHCGSRM